MEYGRSLTRVPLGPDVASEAENRRTRLARIAAEALSVRVGFVIIHGGHAGVAPGHEDAAIFGVGHAEFDEMFPFGHPLFNPAALTVIQDVSADPRAAGISGFRQIIVLPLINTEGVRLGTLGLCGYGVAASAPTSNQLSLLADLANLIVDEISFSHLLDRMQTSSQMQRDALENLSDGLALFDADDRVVFCNQRFKQLFGIAPELELRGSSRNELEARIGPAARSHEDVCELQLPDGRWLRAADRPLSDGSAIAVRTDITENKNAQKRFEFLAYRDSLTGLANRQRFDEQLAASIATGSLFALLSMDLDGFKSVNDRYGHPAGDELLIQVGARLAAEVRGSDLLARWGGDEFAILQPLTDVCEATNTLAARILKRFEPKFEVAGHEVTIGVSIGIAIFPKDGENPARIHRAADIALYHAKTRGAGRIELFAPYMAEALEAREVLAGELRTALENDGLQLYFQPSFACPTGILHGFEALVRWEHPIHGMMSPASFVPLAAEANLSEQLAEWVIEAACRAFARMPENVKLAINLASVDLGYPGLLKCISDKLKLYGVHPSRLEIELPETPEVTEVSAVHEVLASLRALGITLVLDDFGSGRSSLVTLSQLPFSRVKIDMALIHALGQKANADSVLRTVVTLGRSLGLIVAAKGVENQAQLALLVELGCAEVQGFLLGKPVAEIASFNPVRLAMG